MLESLEDTINGETASYTPPNGKNFFKKPHLCSLEAYMLGFIKDENTKRNKDSKTTCQNGAIDPPDCKSCSEGYELVANTCIKKKL